LIIDGLVWPGFKFREAFDLKTGEVKKTIVSSEQVKTLGHHHRCYRNKATPGYIMAAHRGVEMYDLDGDDHSRNNWLRGVCQYGIMPANGLMYVPPHSCTCYMEAKLFGFYAFASERKGESHTEAQSTQRLTKGPGYKQIANSKLQIANSSAWPTFRGDAMRRGVSESKVKAEMAPAWTVQAGTRITTPVISEGTVLVSDINAHTIKAFNEADGGELWSYIAGGRVDSAPTTAGDAVVFGCLDGNVYCLSLKSGQLAWKFQAAPSMLNAMSREQLESVWPVHGSVLVEDGIAYFTAGRNTFLDGGMHMYAVEVKTGKQIASKHLTTGHGGYHPEGGKITGENRQNRWDVKTAEHPDHSDAFSMEGVKNDIMSTDGTSVFLHHKRYNKNLEEQEKPATHLFSTSSFVDDNEHKRTHWFLGYGDFKELGVAYAWMAKSGGKSGYLRTLNGIMMSYDDEAAYIVDRSYTLARHTNRPFDPNEEPQLDFAKEVDKEYKSYSRVWSTSIEIRPRTVLRVGDTLVVGGMPSEIDPAFPYDLVEGKRAGLIQMFSSADGTLTSEIKLPTAVIWDGIAPANNKLYVSTVDGKLICLQ